MGLYKHIRSWLFKHDPEHVHHNVTHALRLLFGLPLGPDLIKLICGTPDKALQQKRMRLTFPSPIGLAAGFDKDGLLAKGVHAFGFGFAEFGTVTPRPQIGNTKPRLWRVVEEQALINSMGFNNDGAQRLADRLHRITPHPIPFGVNLGKNKDTPLDDATGDYLKAMEMVYADADYLVINVSSPNTPQLRELQQPARLQPMLIKIVEAAKRLAIQHGKSPVPVLLKVAPEIEGETLKQICQVTREVGLEGMIGVNTLATEKGGKSGKPLTALGVERVRTIRDELGKDATVIGVGGIFTIDDVLAYLGAGADLVQVYTGWVYQGPRLIHQLNSQLMKKLKTANFTSLSDFLKGPARVRLERTEEPKEKEISL